MNGWIGAFVITDGAARTQQPQPAQLYGTTTVLYYRNRVTEQKAIVCRIVIFYCSANKRFDKDARLSQVHVTLAAPFGREQTEKKKEKKRKEKKNPGPTDTYSSYRRQNGKLFFFF